MTNAKAAIEALMPGEHFISQPMTVGDEVRPPLAQRDTRRVVLYLHRRVVGPFINRQDNEGDTIRLRVHDRDYIRVPSRKWKSVEKVRGLQLARAYQVISQDYLYNEVGDTDLLANPVSVIFGDSAAGSADSAGIPSLAVYEQGASLQTVADATERRTHNALSEAGTMWNVGEEKGFRSSLFDTLYVKEGTDFIQSITLDAPTPESLAFLLLCLDANRYGAGKQVLGPNVRNTVLGALATRNEPPVTPFTVLEDAGEAPPAKLLEAYVAAARQWGGHFVAGDRVEGLRATLRKDGDMRKGLMEELGRAAEAYHQFVYGPKEKKNPKERGKGRGKEAGGA